jgi:hypothetical protein
MFGNLLLSGQHYLILNTTGPGPLTRTLAENVGEINILFPKTSATIVFGFVLAILGST